MLKMLEHSQWKNLLERITHDRCEDYRSHGVMESDLMSASVRARCTVAHEVTFQSFTFDSTSRESSHGHRMVSETSGGVGGV